MAQNYSNLFSDSTRIISSHTRTCLLKLWLSISWQWFLLFFWKGENVFTVGPVQLDCRCRHAVCDTKCSIKCEYGWLKVLLMHMNGEWEEAENDTKKHIFVHSEVNGNFTVFKIRRNHQILSKNSLSYLSGFLQTLFSSSMFQILAEIQRHG